MYDPVGTFTSIYGEVSEISGVGTGVPYPGIYENGKGVLDAIEDEENGIGVEVGETVGSVPTY
tara:strand:- start:10 stop:198 length:189 start_codon:yes stop_codon:yes gene_type:complete